MEVFVCVCYLTLSFFSQCVCVAAVASECHLLLFLAVIGSEFGNQEMNKKQSYVSIPPMIINQILVMLLIHIFPLQCKFCICLIWQTARIKIGAKSDLSI